jgi:hypothetical protein
MEKSHATYLKNKQFATSSVKTATALLFVTGDALFIGEPWE